jgi:hypothetical protein
MDIISCKKYLKMVEEHGLRRPNTVYVAAGLVVENEKKAKISKQDKYAVVEQLAMAALDLNDVETAKRVVVTLYAVFPKSVRQGCCLTPEGVSAWLRGDHNGWLSSID